MPNRHPAAGLQLPSLKTTAGLQPGVVFFPNLAERNAPTAGQSSSSVREEVFYTTSSCGGFFPSRHHFLHA